MSNTKGKGTINEAMEESLFMPSTRQARSNSKDLVIRRLEKKILIIHGFESRAYNFDRYIQPIINAGYGVYAMDAKAHGKSEGKTITVPEYTDMLKELEITVGKFNGYISHSFGGLAISLYQEKGENENARIVLIAPATETTSAIDLFVRFFKF